MSSIPSRRIALGLFFAGLISLMRPGPPAFSLAVDGSPQGLPQAAPELVGFSSSHLQYIDDTVAAAIGRLELPGAVVLVARRGRIAYFKAFGNRANHPAVESMTTDTIFDVASLTKVMATTPAIMLLVERGLVRLEDKVKRYLPEFAGWGKDAITVRQLMTHFSGLRPDFDLSLQWEGYAATMEHLWRETASGEVGKEFVYSDLNFITLGEVVQRVSGQSLDAFVRQNLFDPLGLDETAFNPPPDWRSRIAPTEPRGRSLQYLNGKAGREVSKEILRGIVHDPTAWRMGGVAGHAGLFSSARDVAVYGQLLLNRGNYMGKRIFSPITVEAMTTPQSPRDAVPVRGLGWDIDSTFSAPRGDLLPGGFGHTGFTGTSLWVHPPTETLIVLLSNRVHPEGKGDVTHLRGVIANIVAAAISSN
jgi:CubicO group peptidase (beta-lactamase class C family)